MRWFRGSSLLLVHHRPRCEQCRSALYPSPRARMLAPGAASSIPLCRTPVGYCERRTETRRSQLSVRSENNLAVDRISGARCLRRDPAQVGLGLLDCLGPECRCLRSDCLPHLLLESLQLSAHLSAAITITAISELLCPFGFCARSPLPEGRVDLSTEDSGYSDSEIAIAFPWVDKIHARALEMTDVPRDHRHAVYQRRRGNHRVAMRAGIRHVQSCSPSRRL